MHAQLRLWLCVPPGALEMGVSPVVQPKARLRQTLDNMSWIVHLSQLSRCNRVECAGVWFALRYLLGSLAFRRLAWPCCALVSRAFCRLGLQPSASSPGESARSGLIAYLPRAHFNTSCPLHRSPSARSASRVAGGKPVNSSAMAEPAPPPSPLAEDDQSPADAQLELGVLLFRPCSLFPRGRCAIYLESSGINCETTPANSDHCRTNPSIVSGSTATSESSTPDSTLHRLNIDANSTQRQVFADERSRQYRPCRGIFCQRSFETSSGADQL